MLRIHARCDGRRTVHRVDSAAVGSHALSVVDRHLIAALLQGDIQRVGSGAFLVRKTAVNCADAHRDGHGIAVVAQFDIPHRFENAELVCNAIVKSRAVEHRQVFLALVFADHAAEPRDPLLENGLNFTDRRPVADPHILRQLLQTVDDDIRHYRLFVVLLLFQRHHVGHVVKNHKIVVLAARAHDIAPQVILPALNLGRHRLRVVNRNTVLVIGKVLHLLARLRVADDFAHRNRAEVGQRHVADRRTELQNRLERARHDLDHTVAADDGIRNVHHIAEHIADFGGHEIRRVVRLADTPIARQIRAENQPDRQQVHRKQSKRVKRQVFGRYNRIAALAHERQQYKQRQQYRADRRARNQRGAQIGSEGGRFLFYHLSVSFTRKSRKGISQRGFRRRCRCHRLRCRCRR